MFWRLVFIFAFSGLWSPAILLAQDSADRNAIQQNQPTEPEYKRLFGVIPNYKTTPLQAHYVPISAREKFKLATEDAFDRGTFALAAAFAGKGQLTNDNPSFGQGVEGYAHRFVTSFGDWAIGDYMTEAIFPAMLHQDPRYFRKGTGSGFSRLTYAMGQIFWTRTDSGGHMFNFSEIGGNAAASAIGQAYYPDNRNAASAAETLVVQVGVDMASNVMKEFYPDLQRVLHKHKDAAAPTH
jgi:hypothetical protein